MRRKVRETEEAQRKINELREEHETEVMKTNAVKVRVTGEEKKLKDLIKQKE